MLVWGEFNFEPINLYNAPKLKVVEYKETKVGSKTKITTALKINPIYNQRAKN
tara:strand:- start:488 stop:646 length:159 start_codon:yes stop_codon:yes gene_type:complete